MQNSDSVIWVIFTLSSKRWNETDGVQEKIEGNEVKFFFLANIFAESCIYFFVEFIFFVHFASREHEISLLVKYPFDYFLILNYFHSLLHRYGHFEIRIFPEQENDRGKSAIPFLLDFGFTIETESI